MVTISLSNVYSNTAFNTVSKRATGVPVCSQFVRRFRTRDWDISMSNVYSNTAPIVRSQFERFAVSERWDRH